MAQLKSGTTIAGSTVWHAGNDGSGSGLDAGLLGGQSSSYYATASLSNVGTLPTNVKAQLKGDTGPTGPAGPSGTSSTVPGPTGPTGPTGPAGPAGGSSIETIAYTTSSLVCLGSSGSAYYNYYTTYTYKYDTATIGTRAAYTGRSGNTYVGSCYGCGGCG